MDRPVHLHPDRRADARPHRGIPALRDARARAGRAHQRSASRTPRSRRSSCSAEHHEPRAGLRVLSRRRPLLRQQPARRHEPGGQGVRRGARRRARRADPEPVHRRGARAARGAHRQSVRHRPVRRGAAHGAHDAAGGAARAHAADARPGPGVQRVPLGRPDAARRRADAPAAAGSLRRSAPSPAPIRASATAVPRPARRGAPGQRRSRRALGLLPRHRRHPGRHRRLARTRDASTARARRSLAAPARATGRRAWRSISGRVDRRHRPALRRIRAAVGGPARARAARCRAAAYSITPAGSTRSRAARARRLAQVVARHPGLLLEDKGLSLALHYRQAPHLGGYAHRLVRALARRRSATRTACSRASAWWKSSPPGRTRAPRSLEFMAERAVPGADCRCSLATTSPTSTASPTVERASAAFGQGRRRADAARAGGCATCAAVRAVARRAAPARAPARGREADDARSISRSIGNGTIGCLIDGSAAIVWGCFPAIRRRPALLLAAPRTRRPSAELGYLRGRSRSTARRSSRSTSPTRRSSSPACTTRRGGVRRDHRLRAALPAARPDVLPHDAGAPASGASRGNPAHRGSACGRATGYGAHAAAIDQRQQPHPLRGDRRRAAPHDRRVDHRDRSRRRAFFLEDTVTLLLGPDETVHGSGRAKSAGTSSRRRSRTGANGCATSPFRSNGRTPSSARPSRSKLNAFEDTGAIIAAMTTSIPESAGSGRNWDYRYCWLRDALFRGGCAQPARAPPGRWSATSATSSTSWPARRTARLQPVYGIGGRAVARGADRGIASRAIAAWDRSGSATRRYRQVQHDVYGSAILAATHVFFDRRLSATATRRCSSGSKRSASAPHRCFDQPDAGIWELRGAARVHTFSSVMCWAGCDRLARIAAQLGLDDRARILARAGGAHPSRRLRARLERRARQLRRHHGRRRARREPAAAARARLPGGRRSALRRHRATRSNSDLRRGDFIFRYVEQDDFGAPQNAFLVCTFWYINALAALGRRDEARALFEKAAGVPQPARPAGRGHRPDDAANCGATSCRPTAWSG